MSDDRHTLRNDRISATVLKHGAELCSLKTADGLELLWQAGPEWPRHSPLLFPIIGEVRGEQIRVRGKVYPMLRHGVARDHDFAFTELHSLRRQGNSLQARTAHLVDGHGSNAGIAAALERGLPCRILAKPGLHHIT